MTDNQNSKCVCWVLKNKNEFVAVHSSEFACIIEATSRGWGTGGPIGSTIASEGNPWLVKGVTITKVTMP